MSDPFKTWKDYSNSKSGEDQFKYQDSTPDAISSDKEFPETGYQENPEKM